MHPEPALPPHLLRLADAGDAKPAWITLLTTEHYNLGMQRAATISEVNGRASIFIGAVSAGLIALGFEGAGSRHSAGSTVFAALVLTSLLFLGLVTFGRCLQIAIDDWEFSVRIMRLRAAYAQLVPELAGLLAEADTDEAEVSMFAGRWQALQKMLSVAGSMAVISSVVLGADAGVVAYGLSASLLAALLAGTAAGTVLMFVTARYQWGRWCGASSAPARTSALSAGPAGLSVSLARTLSESQRRSMTCTSLKPTMPGSPTRSAGTPTRSGCPRVKATTRSSSPELPASTRTAPSRPISLTRRARRGRTSERSWLRQAPRSATSSAAAST